MVVGGFAGTAAMANSVVIADGGGNVRLRWDEGQLNGVHALDATVPTLTENNTMVFQYDSATQGVKVYVRNSAGSTVVVELTNERPVGTTLGSSTGLSAGMRNRFTPVSSAGTVTLTLAAYAGIVTGSEHEFYNRGGTVTFSAGTGITILSNGGRLSVTLYGAAVAKYLGSNTFCLIGALE